MGFGQSKNSGEIEEKDKTIDGLNSKIRMQNDIINMLNNEVGVLRSYRYSNNLSKKNLDLINQVWQAKDYHYLVCSGGGIKGISYGGAFAELENYGILYQDGKFKIKGICGVSAGSIASSLIAVGYNPKELDEIMSTIDFEEIADDKLGYIRDTINFFEDWGICPGAYIMELMGDLIKKKTGNADYTLEDLYRDTGLKLVIVATDMTYQRSVYFYAGNSVKEYSNIPIRKAVRMSMGIPLMFEPYEYHGSYFVDGGVLDNYPLHCFDGEYPGDPKARLNLCEPNHHVLGLRITTSDEFGNYKTATKHVYTGLFQYGMSFINTFLTENDRRVMTPSFWVRTIMIITPNYPLSKFDLTDKEKEELVTIGKNYVNEFFTKNTIKLCMIEPLEEKSTE